MTIRISDAFKPGYERVALNAVGKTQPPSGAGKVGSAILNQAQAALIGQASTATAGATLPPAPTITSLSPTSLTDAGGSLQINGTNLLDAAVTVDGVAVTVTSNGNTALTVTVSAHIAAMIVVSVTTAGGTATANLEITASVAALYTQNYLSAEPWAVGTLTAISEAPGGRLLAGLSMSNYGPLFLGSSDGGDTWAMQNDGLGYGGVYDIIKTPGAVVALVDNGAYGSNSYVVIRSTDGVNWSPAGALNGSYGGSLPNSQARMYGNADGSVLLLVTASGRFEISNDGGQTWSYTGATRPANIPALYRVSMVRFLNGQWVFITDNQGAAGGSGTLADNIFASADGVTWTAHRVSVVNHPLGAGYATNNWTDINYINGHYVAANAYGYVSVSTNLDSWTQHAVASNQPKGMFARIEVIGSRLILVTHNLGHDTVNASSARPDIYESINTGSTWTFTTDPTFCPNNVWPYVVDTQVVGSRMWVVGATYDPNNGNAGLILSRP